MMAHTELNYGKPMAQKPVLHLLKISIRDQAMQSIMVYLILMVRFISLQRMVFMDRSYGDQMVQKPVL